MHFYFDRQHTTHHIRIVMKLQSTHTPTGAGDSAAQQVMRDLVAYVQHTYADGTINTARKLDRIVATMLHDLHGHLEQRPFFEPRTKGWANAVEKAA
jgi:hypothetical protein